jgi:Uma2 family endonuclease
MSLITSAESTLPASGPGWIPSRLYRMTIDEYERMVAAGFILSRNRIHLINGYLVDKMTQNPPHVIAVNRSRDELNRIKPPGWHLRSAQPIRLPGQDSEPEPDHCLARGGNDDYLDGHPEPADIALIVEVADTSLADDRDYATRLYGPAGIPVCWIVDLRARRVEVCTEPGPLGYGATQVYAEGQSVPVVIDGQEVGRIAVSDILPPRRPRTTADGNGE